MNNIADLLDYIKLREEVHEILCDFLHHEHPILKNYEFDFEYLESSTDRIINLIKRQGGSMTKDV